MDPLGAVLDRSPEAARQRASRGRGRIRVADATLDADAVRRRAAGRRRSTKEPGVFAIWTQIGDSLMSALRYSRSGAEMKHRGNDPDG